jgi:hypothetical protein
MSHSWHHCSSDDSDQTTHNAAHKLHAGSWLSPALSKEKPYLYWHIPAVPAVLAALGALSSVFLCVLALRTAGKGLQLP